MRICLALYRHRYYRRLSSGSDACGEVVLVEQRAETGAKSMTAQMIPVLGAEAKSLPKYTIGRPGRPYARGARHYGNIERASFFLRST